MQLITKEQIAAWWSMRNQGMTSAVGEYTPSEFWDVLEAYESQQKDIDELVELLPEILNDPPESETEVSLWKIVNHHAKDTGSNG